MNIVVIRCMSCREKIGKMDRDTIHLPLDDKQFLALNEGIKTPFPPDMDPWLWKCPICEMRPYVEQDRWMLDNGYYVIVRKQEKPVEVFDPETDLEIDEPMPLYTCVKCERNFGTKTALMSHIRNKHKE